jgi:phosphate transport system substrate-binding protein
VNRLVKLAIIAVSVLAVSSLLTGTVTAQSPKIELVVVAVPEFATDKYNVKGFKDAIEERCQDIQTFFEKHIGKEHLEPHVFCTREDTTSTKIKRLFQTDFQNIAADTLTFVFIISHGEPSTYNNLGLPTDLRIVTSTSDPNEPDLSYLSFSTELLAWFQKIPAGSTVLTFVDTCYAGSAVSPAAAIAATVQQVFGGMRLFVMGSSLRLEESYGAAFTKALLTLWDKQEGCVDPQAMENDIRNEIDASVEVPLNDFQGIAKVIVGYAGPLCFTNFGADGRLLFLYGGAGQKDTVWKVFEGTKVVPDRRPLKRGAFTERFFDMARLNKGNYVVQLLTEGETPVETIVDLNAHTFEPVFAKQPKSVSSLRTFVEAMRDATVANGKSIADSEVLNQVVSSLNKAGPSANSLLRSMTFSGQSFENLATLRHAISRNKNEAQTVWMSAGITPDNAGVGLFLLGDFSNSAEAFRVQARSVKDKESRYKFAETSSIAFNLAGRPTDAEQVAMEFELRNNIQANASPSDHDYQVAQILHVAGTTSAYPLYIKWLDSYHLKNPGPQFNFQSTGSGAGIRQVTEGTVDFGTSDSPMSDEELAAYRSKNGSDILHFPTAVIGIVPIYNLPGIRKPLNLTPEALAGIFLGKITKWNDPAIVNANEGIILPRSEIVVIHRSDRSATIAVLSDYLSKVSGVWKSEIGKGSSANWPVGLGAKGDEGVAGIIRQTPNSIGFVDFIYAQQNRLPFGAIRNAAGIFVSADLQNLTAAAANFARDIPDDFRSSITNAPGKDAYPLSSLTWLLIPERIPDPAKRDAVKNFLRFVLSDGQTYAEQLGYAKLPRELASREEKTISRIR